MPHDTHHFVLAFLLRQWERGTDHKLSAFHWVQANPELVQKFESVLSDVKDITEMRNTVVHGVWAANADDRPEGAEDPHVRDKGPEREVRLLYESASKTQPLLDIPIDLSCVLRITLSPWVHPRLKNPIVNAVKSIPGCSRLSVRRSTLISNAEWRKLGEKAA